MVVVVFVLVVLRLMHVVFVLVHVVILLNELGIILYQGPVTSCPAATRIATRYWTLGSDMRGNITRETPGSACLGVWILKLSGYDFCCILRLR